MAGNDPFLSKKASHKLTKQKDIHNSAKTYDILIKEKVFESLLSGFVISVKKSYFLF